MGRMCLLIWCKIFCAGSYMVVEPSPVAFCFTGVRKLPPAGLLAPLADRFELCRILILPERFLGAGPRLSPR